MRILFIHNKYQFPGGEDSVVESERSILESKGHVVKVFFFDNAEIGSFANKLTLSYRLLFNTNSANTVSRLIGEFMPDVIHVHNFFYIASPSILFAAHKSKVPVVVTLHNYRLICSGALLMRNSLPCEICVNQVFPMAGIKYGCHRDSKVQTAHLTLTTGIHKLLNTWNSKVSLYISLTEFAKNKFIHSSLKLLPEKVVVKPNSVEDFGLSADTDREDCFLYVGRLSPEKGVDVLLKAFNGSSRVLEIIGNGPMKEDVEKTMSGSRNIKYSGYKDRSYIAERLKKCRALIVPSVCYESLPTAVLEAFSAGTPVIISDIGNLNEIVTNNFNGLHFKTNDPIDLARVTDKLSAHHPANADLYLNARNTYLEKYTPEMNYQQLMGVYRQAIGKGI